MNDYSDGPRMTLAGKLVVVLFIAGSLYGAYWLFMRGTGDVADPLPGQNPPVRNDPDQDPASSVPAPIDNGGQPIEIGIAYGTEKRYWIEGAAKEFALTPAGRQIKVNLIGLGSQESAHAILAEDKKIHVWSPASAVYKDVFVQDWQIKNGDNPILSEESLALSPMVFVMWDERYEAFIKKYKSVDFTTIKQALSEPGGWEEIAGQPEWGFFKFSHTNPTQSNSGLITLALAAHDFHKKSKGLTVSDITNAPFQKWLRELEQGVSGLSNSSGVQMREMVLKGPSTFDCLFTYENLTIDYLKSAEGRYGKLRVVYPQYNMWNDNPYYILNVPWCTPDQRRAAAVFRDFLLTEAVQRRSLDHGFRPADPKVPINFAESPFVRYQPQGLQIKMGTVCDPPRGDVITNLLLSWQRIHGGR